MSTEAEELRQVSPYITQPDKNYVETATTDPDREWTVWKNPEYGHINWDSTPDGSYEKIVAKETPLDSYSGLNWNKMNAQPGGYYALDIAPIVEYEFDEEQYFRDFVPDKSDEQVQAELEEPAKKMVEKLMDYEEKGQDLVWTPTMAAMAQSNVATQARALEYEISPFFQLNQQGYRKNFANIRLVEYRPLCRITSMNWFRHSCDYWFRFQFMRAGLSSRQRNKYFRVVFVAGFAGLFIDHVYSREYRRGYKWH